MADYGDQSETLDAAQAVKAAYDKAKVAHRVTLAGSGGIPDKVIAVDMLVTEDYDSYELSYITSGPGVGDVGLILFKKMAATVAVISFTYDSNNSLIKTERL